VHAFLAGEMRNSRERNARRLEAVYGTDMNSENRQITEDFAWYRTRPACKKRLLKNRKLRFSGNEGALFKLLVLFNRL
jgi:hypothetical protein